MCKLFLDFDAQSEFLLVSSQEVLYNYNLGAQRLPALGHVGDARVQHGVVDAPVWAGGWSRFARRRLLLLGRRGRRDFVVGARLKRFIDEVGQLARRALAFLGCRHRCVEERCAGEQRCSYSTTKKNSQKCILFFLHHRSTCWHDTLHAAWHADNHGRGVEALHVERRVLGA